MAAIEPQRVARAVPQEFHPGSRAKARSARITADSRYVLYVNGQEVSRGPVRSQPRRMMYDLVDLAPYLKAGENLIAVYVKYYGRPNSFYIPPVPNSGLG